MIRINNKNKLYAQTQNNLNLPHFVTIPYVIPAVKLPTINKMLQNRAIGILTGETILSAANGNAKNDAMNGIVLITICITTFL